ncbi:MAG: hypothetical protein COB02_15195 [Candidatus Cloacimonadota bacterium]|nr:MAG: hypothetical protein COB02_15195 [Candidatus Cloacimonadota bacterium]
MLNSFFTKIKQHQKLFLEIFFLITFCFWFPLADSNLSKLVSLFFLPILFYKKNKATHLFLIINLLLISLFYISKYSSSYIFFEITFLTFFFLGINYSKHKLNRVILLTTFLAFLFFIAQKFNFLPFIWQQIIVLLNYEFLYVSFTHPSFFGNPSPMCLFFVLATYSIKNENYKLKIFYLLLCTPMILLSDSTIGIFLFFISSTYLFLNQIHLKKIILFSICLSFLVFVFKPNLILRPFQTRLPLYQLTFDNANFMGHGPGTFHLHSGQLKGDKTTKYHLTRNQFHPHNDLLYYFYSYGLLGLFLRLLLYLFVLYLFYLNYLAFPLILFLVQIQFSPDAFSIPSALLFFFFLGQNLQHLLKFKSQKSKLSSISKYLAYLLTGFFTLQLLSYSLNFQKILNSSPKSKLIFKQNHYFSAPTYIYNLGVYYLKSQQLQLAKKTFNKLQKDSPNFQDLDYLLAYVYYNENKIILAKQSLQNKLKIDPYHVYTYLFLADILIELKNKKSAIETIKKGLMCLPKDKLLNNRLSSLE